MKIPTMSRISTPNNSLAPPLALASLALFATPLTSHADSDAAIDACVKAFVSANLPKQQPVTVRKVDTTMGGLESFSRTYHIALSARSTNGEPLAMGTCVVKRNGTVLALKSEPRTTPRTETTLAAKETEPAKL